MTVHKPNLAESAGFVTKARESFYDGSRGARGAQEGTQVLVFVSAKSVRGVSATGVSAGNWHLGC